MDVRLPNGRIIQNVPDGTSKQAIAQKAISAGLATQADFGITMRVRPKGDHVMPSAPTPDTASLLAAGREQAARETGPLEAGLIAAGHTSSRIASGAQDIADVPAALLGGPSSEAAKRISQRGESVRQGDELMAPLKSEHPVSTAVGGAVPYVAAPMRVPGMSAGASNIVVPALTAAIESGSPQERAERGLLAAGGGALGTMLPRALAGRPFADDMDEYLRDVVMRGERMGFRTLPSTRKGPVAGREMRTREAAIESSPRTGGKISAIKEDNRRNLTRIAAREMGMDADRLTPDRLQTIRDDIGQEFEDAGRGQVVHLDAQFKQTLRDIKDSYSEGAGRRSKKITNAVDDLLAKGDTMTPAEYKRQTSALVKDAMSAGTKDAAKGDALLDVRAALDDAFDRSVPGDLAKLREARDKWRTMLMVEQAVNEAGDVSFAKLASIVRRKDQWGYLRGNKKSDLYDALRYFKAFPSEFGSSGTAERLAGQASPVKDAMELARDGAILGGVLDLAGGGATGGTGAMVGGTMGGLAGLTRSPRERLAASLYLSPALNRGAIPAGPGGLLASQSGQDLFGRTATRLLTPGLLSLPQSE